ncbi:hypothetical protein BGZ60DRAFT_557162 [Tricladium varicosporioides]|nr:hypothetical protein BGZ60DRAFT_557162 [Hymenoscyphus varicosporioides]
MCYRDTNTYPCGHVEIQSIDCCSVVFLFENSAHEFSGCPKGVEEREKWYNYKCRSCELTRRRAPATARKVVEFGREMGAAIRAAISDEPKEEAYQGPRKIMAGMMNSFHATTGHEKGWQIPDGKTLGSEDILQKFAKRGEELGLLKTGATEAKHLFKYSQNDPLSSGSLGPPQEKVIVYQVEEDAILHQLSARPRVTVRTVNTPRRRVPRLDLRSQPESMLVTVEQEQEAFTAINRADRLSYIALDDRAQRRDGTQREGSTARRGELSELLSDITTIMNARGTTPAELGNDLPETSSRLSQSSSKVGEAKPQVPKIVIEFTSVNNWLWYGGREDVETLSRDSSGCYLVPPPIPRRSSIRPRTRNFALVNSEATTANSANTTTTSAIQIGASKVVQPSQSRLQISAQARAARPFTDFAQL